MNTKYLAIVIFIMVSALGGYWYGYAVGFTESRILVIGEYALHEINAIEELKYNPNVNAIDLHEIEINKAITLYGEYKEEGYIALPMFPSAKSAINWRLNRLIAYRKKNPRILNGVEYAPLPHGYKNMEFFDTLDLALKQKILQDEEYYKSVIEE